MNLPKGPKYPSRSLFAQPTVHQQFVNKIAGSNFVKWYNIKYAPLKKWHFCIASDLPNCALNLKKKDGACVKMFIHLYEFHLNRLRTS